MVGLVPENTTPDNLDVYLDALFGHALGDGYAPFDFSDPYNPSNDDFEVEFTLIDDSNPDADALIDRPELTYKIVEQNGIDYKLYILSLREGLGNTINPLDRAVVTYRGNVRKAKNKNKAMKDEVERLKALQVKK